MTEHDGIDMTALIDRLREEFGPDVRLVLSWCDDPEIKGYSYVVGDVRMPVYDADFVKRLCAFQRNDGLCYREWFLLKSTFTTPVAFAKDADDD